MYTLVVRWCTIQWHNGHRVRDGYWVHYIIVVVVNLCRGDQSVVTGTGYTILLWLLLTCVVTSVTSRSLVGCLPPCHPHPAEFHHRQEVVCPRADVGRGGEHGILEPDRLGVVAQVDI